MPWLVFFVAVFLFLDLEKSFSYTGIYTPLSVHAPAGSCPVECVLVYSEVKRQPGEGHRARWAQTPFSPLKKQERDGSGWDGPDWISQVLGNALTPSHRIPGEWYLREDERARPPSVCRSGVSSKGHGLSVIFERRSITVLLRRSLCHTLFTVLHMYRVNSLIPRQTNSSHRPYY